MLRALAHCVGNQYCDATLIEAVGSRNFLEGSASHTCCALCICGAKTVAADSELHGITRACVHVHMHIVMQALQFAAAAATGQLVKT